MRGQTSSNLQGSKVESIKAGIKQSIILSPRSHSFFHPFYVRFGSTSCDFALKKEFGAKFDKFLSNRNKPAWVTRVDNRSRAESAQFR